MGRSFFQANLIKNCSGERTKRVILAGSWNEDASLLFQQIFSTPLPVQLIRLYQDSTFPLPKDIEIVHLTEEIVRRKSYIATSCVIITTSNATLSLSLEALRVSSSWNTKAFFLVVNKNFEEGCETARSLLHTVWVFNVLSAALLCRHSSGQMYLYTFNPYTRSAPKFWNAIESIDMLNNHSWSLFKHALKTPLHFFGE